MSGKVEVVGLCVQTDVLSCQFQRFWASSAALLWIMNSSSFKEVTWIFFVWSHSLISLLVLEDVGNLSSWLTLTTLWYDDALFITRQDGLSKEGRIFP